MELSGDSKFPIYAPMSRFDFHPNRILVKFLFERESLRESINPEPPAMARHLIVLALIFVAVLAAAVSAQSPSSSPKAAPSSSESSSVAPPPKKEEEAAPAPKESSTTTASPESSPALAPESDYSAPPAPGSEAYAPSEGPSEFLIDDSAPAPSGAYGLEVSSAVAGVAAAVAGLGLLL